MGPFLALDESPRVLGVPLSEVAHLAFLCDHVCGCVCLPVLVFGVLVLSLGLHGKGGVLSSHRGPGGAGEAERLSGWRLCVRVLPQRPGEVQHCRHMGGPPHSKEVSLCFDSSGGAGPRAGSPWWLPELQEGKRSALLQTFFFFCLPGSLQTFGLFSKAAESRCGFSCLALNQMLAVWGRWEAEKPEGAVIESKWTVCLHTLT